MAEKERSFPSALLNLCCRQKKRSRPLIVSKISARGMNRRARILQQLMLPTTVGNMDTQKISMAFYIHAPDGAVSWISSLPSFMNQEEAREREKVKFNGRKSQSKSDRFFLGEISVASFRDRRGKILLPSFFSLRFPFLRDRSDGQ